MRVLVLAASLARAEPVFSSHQPGDARGIRGGPDGKGWAPDVARERLWVVLMVSQGALRSGTQ